ncbi:MAG: hypothetical protein IIZ56_02985, partial [Clostridia bacterium]|nr:hypothetical protein [Clostridia bacterium]
GSEQMGWVQTAFAVVYAAGQVVNGALGRRVDPRRHIVTGMALSLLGTAVFLLTRQPYAGVIYLAVMAAKGLLLLKGKLKP